MVKLSARFGFGVAIIAATLGGLFALGVPEPQGCGGTAMEEAGGKLTGEALRIQCGNQRVNPKTNANHCGLCDHSCLGGTCSKGQCQPIALARQQRKADYLAIDATNVYWTSPDTGTVQKVPLNGGTPINLTIEQYGCANLTVDATSVYFTKANRTSLYKAPLSGGSTETLKEGDENSHPDHPQTLFLIGDWVYWSVYETVLLTTQKSTGTTYTKVQDFSQRFFRGGDNSVFWSGRNHNLERITPNGSRSPTYDVFPTRPGSYYYENAAMAGDLNNMYYSGDVNAEFQGYSAGSFLYSIPLSGGSPPVQLVSAPNGVRDIVIDGSWLYYIDNHAHDDGSDLRRVDKSTGLGATTLVTFPSPRYRPLRSGGYIVGHELIPGPNGGFTDPKRLVVSSDAIYLAAGDSILKLAK